MKKLKQLSLGTRFSLVAIIALVLGIGVTVLSTQQNQDTRSRAAGTGGTGNCSTVNASTGEDLVANNCTIASGFNGSVIGNYNIIQGGVGGPVGNIIGSNNTIYGGVNGCIKGNNNEIWGGVNGGVDGTGNIIHGAYGTGPCPKPSPTVPPTQAPTVMPTRANGTCADGIDNNENELIDSGDPICHTDGNQDNPNSYDPTRNEGGIPTIYPTTVPPTISPTVGPTVTVSPGNMSISLRLFLHGIGKGGDSANPNSGGNPNPLHPQRTAKVEVFNSQNQLVATKDAQINFASATGDFRGSVNLGNLATGFYTIKVKTEQFLKTLVPGIQNLAQGQTYISPVTTMVNGDINNDNTLNILDYNILMGCYSDFEPPVSCTSPNEIFSDLDDDGDVNQFDYNLFLRELANRQGE